MSIGVCYNYSMNKFVDILGDSLDNIKIFEDFMDPDDLDKVVSFLRTINDSGITNKFLNVTDDYEVPTEIDDLMIKYTDIVNDLGEKSFGYRLDGSDKLAMRIGTPGIYYMPHVDSPSTGELHEEGMYDPNWRDSWAGELAILIYLNDDYEGGELYFPERGLEIKPKANTLIMFPGNKNFVHGVRVIEKTDRLNLVKWSLFID
jgi:hypothetical protein